MPWEQLVQLVQRPPLEDMEVDASVAKRTEAVFGEPLTPQEVVERIIADVRRDGDGAVADYARRLDGMDLPPARFFVGDDEIEAAYEAAQPQVVAAIRRARDNIRIAHEAQKRRDWFHTMPTGAVVGQRYVPMERVAA